MLSTVSVGCRCQCGAAKCQGYLEADSAHNRAALLMDADSGLDDAGYSLVVSNWKSAHGSLCDKLLACISQDCESYDLHYISSACMSVTLNMITIIVCLPHDHDLPLNSFLW